MSNAPLSLPSVIRGFITERENAALEKIKNTSEKQQQVIEKYQYHTWLADAARRATQIHLATHTVKAIHSDAKASAINCSKNTQKNIISSQSIDSKQLDVVGNAAALDVFKFLNCTYEGESILSRAARQDKTLKDAFDHPNAEDWMHAFATIIDSEPPSSHALLKQIYWPSATGNYHLLLPLYPSILVHNVYQYVQHWRFSLEAKKAREAQRNNLYSEHVVRYFSNLVVLHMGGSNTQNISMLNNQRHGNAYLFASLPPKWNRMLARPPVNTTSIFQRGYFPSHKEVRRLLRLLKPLVRQDYSNVKMRDARKKLVAAIIDELLQYAGQIRNLAPEWVDKAKLNREEAFWLAPNKALYDSDWAEQRLNEDWPVQIRHRFAVWLNSELNTPNLEPEYLEWKHGEWQYDIEDEMRILVEESLS